MTLFNNLNLGTRLGVAFATLILMGFVVVSFGIQQLSSLSESLSVISADRVPKVKKLTEVTDDVNLIARELRNALIFEDPIRVEDAIEIAVGARERIAKVFDEIGPSIQSVDGKERLADTLKARGAYVPLQNRFIDVVRAGDMAEAERLLVEEMRSAQLGYMASLDEFKDFQVHLITNSAAKGEQSYQTARKLLLAMLAGMAAIGGLLAFFFVRSVTGPIRQAVLIAEMVAGGDLTAEIQVTKRDETGRLLGALKSMNGSLARVVNVVRTSSDSIAQRTGGIATGNSDLNRRTEEQARSLEQTAASMEELDVTVKQNAESARQATNLAKNAAQVAARGGEAVTQVIEAMEGVTASSARIADIISVIDGIAFQTNLLALNAAVEAARAGDHGKGFAVVASEVGDLAHRSADAALEIKGLISASSKQVADGSGLVDQAGLTMKEVVECIGQVAALMDDISASSEEQSKGVSLVGDAMAEIDRVTRQNVLLVEQSAGAADSLQSEASVLVNAVAVFKMDGIEDPVHANA